MNTSVSFTGRLQKNVLSYATREQAKQDIFEYMEIFYNRKRRHSFNNQLSPVEYEKRYITQE